MTAQSDLAQNARVQIPHFDRATIRARLAESLKSDKPWNSAAGDYAISQHLAKEGGGLPPLVPPPAKAVLMKPEVADVAAAVLVPLIEREGGYSVLLTQRTARLSKHAGQVAFPGGRMDPEDLDPEACALREAWEETRLDPAKVEILGRLVPWVTGSGFYITPVVGAVTPPIDLTPDPHEVDAIFEVPLAFFLDPANHRRVVVEYEGAMRHYYEMPYGDRYIWGATAGMLVYLYNALMT
jgi:8-oxo-dGTP pyrophosphatase MutT (NUDIX family)